MTDRWVGGGLRGFRLLLPDDWIEIDVDPETQAWSWNRLVELLARHDQTVARQRQRVEELLRRVADNAVTEGAELCAIRFETGPDGTPVHAVITVALRSVDGSTDPAALLEMIEQAGGDPREADAIKTASGTALRLAEHATDACLYLTAFVPIPDVPGRLAMIQLVSPSLTHEDQLRGFFDAIVSTFAFTWEDDGG